VEYRPGDIPIVYEAHAEHADLARPVDDRVAGDAETVEGVVWRHVRRLTRDLAVLGFVTHFSRKIWPFVRAAAVPVLATITPQRKAATVFADIPASMPSLTTQHDRIGDRPWQLADRTRATSAVRSVSSETLNWPRVLSLDRLGPIGGNPPRVRFPPPPLSPQIAGFRWRRS
jgi:hypothetical protein